MLNPNRTCTRARCQPVSPSASNCCEVGSILQLQWGQGKSSDAAPPSYPAHFGYFKRCALQPAILDKLGCLGYQGNLGCIRCVWSSWVYRKPWASKGLVSVGHPGHFWHLGRPSW
eukprot:9503078-Pyramimonas_sp.AAC.1